MMIPGLLDQRRPGGPVRTLATGYLATGLTPPVKL